MYRVCVTEIIILKLLPSCITCCQHDEKVMKTMTWILYNVLITRQVADVAQKKVEALRTQLCTALRGRQTESSQKTGSDSAPRGRGVQGGKILGELQERKEIQRVALRPAAAQRCARGRLPRPQECGIPSKMCRRSSVRRWRHYGPIVPSVPTCPH